MITEKQIREHAKRAVESTTDHKTLAYQEIVKRLRAEWIIAKLISGDSKAVDEARELIGMD